MPRYTQNDRRAPAPWSLNSQFRPESRASAGKPMSQYVVFNQGGKRYPGWAAADGTIRPYKKELDDPKKSYAVRHGLFYGPDGQVHYIAKGEPHSAVRGRGKAVGRFKKFHKAFNDDIKRYGPFYGDDEEGRKRHSDDVARHKSRQIKKYYDRPISRRLPEVKILRHVLKLMKDDKPFNAELPKAMNLIEERKKHFEAATGLFAGRNTHQNWPESLVNISITGEKSEDNKKEVLKVIRALVKLVGSAENFKEKQAVYKGVYQSLASQNDMKTDEGKFPMNELLKMIANKGRFHINSLQQFGMILPYYLVKKEWTEFTADKWDDLRVKLVENWGDFTGGDPAKGWNLEKFYGRKGTANKVQGIIRKAIGSAKKMAKRAEKGVAVAPAAGSEVPVVPAPRLVSMRFH